MKRSTDTKVSLLGYDAV